PVHTPALPPFPTRRSSVLVPGVQVAVGRVDRVPAGVALEHVGVVLLEHLRPDGRGDGVADFLRGRPDVLEVDRLAVAARAQGLRDRKSTRLNSSHVKISYA